MRKRLAGGAVALAGVVALGFGGTFAALSDVEDGPRTLLESGTLDLALSDSGGAVTEPVRFANLQPGDTSRYFVRLTNEGSIAGSVDWAFRGVKNLENTCTPPEADAGDRTCGTNSGQGELGTQLAVTFFLLPTAECTDTGGTQVIPQTFPADSNRGYRRLNVDLAEDDVRCVRADVEFLELGKDNNLAQSDSTEFRFDFRLKQKI